MMSNCTDGLSLPPFYLITPELENDEKVFLQTLRKSLDTGIKLVQLRVKSLSKIEYKNLALKALEICHEYEARLLLNNDISLAAELNVNGVHLTSESLMKCEMRPVGLKLVFASCHNEKELKQAEKLGLNGMTLSPVLPTQSHPEAKPLGWENFSKLILTVNIPCYALGGMEKHHMAEAKKYGAVGIAAIRAFWNV